MVDRARPILPMPDKATAKDADLNPKAIPNDKPNPSTPSPAWKAMEKKRKLPRTLMGGTEAMRGDKSLTPRLEAEDEATSYKDRVANSYLYEAYKSHVESLTGKVFAADLELVDVPEDILELWGNIDRLGVDGDVFSARVCEQSLAYGLEAILVDFPPAREDGQPRTRAQDQAEAIRPYWVHINGEQILEAVPMTVGAEVRLAELRYIETRNVKRGAYETVQEEWVMHYYRGDPSESDIEPNSKRWARVESWRKEKTSKGQWAWMLKSTRPMKPQVEIPIVPVPTGACGYFFSHPPLEGLAQLNLQHWQKQSHYDRVLLSCARPVPVVPTDSESIEVGAFGPDQALYTGDPEVKPYWLELSGQSIPAIVQSLERIENQMQMAGFEPMMRKATGDEKSTIRLLDEAKAATALQRWAKGWTAALTDCLRFTAIWMGLESGGVVKLKKGIYESLRMSSDASDITRGLAAGGLSAHGWQTEMQRQGKLSEEHDIEADMQRLESQKSFGMGGLGMGDLGGIAEG